MGNCIHWWVIESPNGPTSRGRCKFCRAERDFWNNIEHQYPFQCRPGAQARGGGKGRPKRKEGIGAVA